MNFTPPPRALLLTNENSPGTPFQFECARSLLEKVGLAARQGSSLNGGMHEYKLLWILGGIEIRNYLNHDPTEEGRVLKPTKDLIRSFHNAGKIIVAPCMGLPVVLESLKDAADPFLLAQTMETGSLVEYSKINLITTRRPLLGKSHEQIEAVFSEIAGLISNRNI